MVRRVSAQRGSDGAMAAVRWLKRHGSTTATRAREGEHKWRNERKGATARREWEQE